MNPTASHLANRKGCQRAAEKEKLLKAERVWDKEVINKRKDYFKQGYLTLVEGRGQSGILPHWCQHKILDRLVKIIFLGEAEIAIRLGINFWFADVGLNTSDPILGLFSLF